MASGWDQFVENVLKQEGQLHQIMRDLGFMVPDLVHLVLPWYDLKELARRRNLPPSHLIKTNDFIVAVATVFTLWLVSALIPS